MSKSIHIDLPKPCGKNWSAMAPNAQGAYCNSCAQNVIDFSTKTDAEVYAILTRGNGKLCGRFTGDQLKRPLTGYSESVSASRWKTVIAGLGTLFYAVRSFGFSGNDHPQLLPPVVNSVEDTATFKIPVDAEQKSDLKSAVKTIEIKGRVIVRCARRNWRMRYTSYKHQRPVKGTKVVSKNSSLIAYTDKKGYFVMQLPADLSDVLTITGKDKDYKYLSPSRDVSLKSFLGKKHPVKICMDLYPYIMGCPRF